MAIDFPNSPVSGDLYTAGGKTWQWNGTYWAAYGTGPVLRTSDTAPVSPNNGDLWYETDTGRFFTYYDSVWVEIGNATDIAGALQPGQVTALSAVTSLTSDDVFPVIDNPSSATAANKITYGNLATAMSTSLAPGLVFITEVTLSGTSVNVANCFSSTYENYRLVFSNILITGAADIMFRLRSGSTTATGANYQMQSTSVSGGTVSGIADVNVTEFRGCLSGSTYEGSSTVEIFRPFVADTTISFYTTFGQFSGTYYWRSGGGIHTLTTSYDSLNFYTIGSSMSGTVRIYGYRNS